MAQIKALEFAENNYTQFLEKLIDFVKIESVSSDSTRADEILKAAQWLANKLDSLGAANISILETPLHPVVYGEILTNESFPTILVYGHYDVQPEDPIDLWKSSPFNAVVRDGNLYGRGASDMKGQIIAGLAAIESIIETDSLPVNLKFIYEGEEEIGSPSIRKFMQENADLLEADVVLNLDAGMLAADLPTITYGLRGLAYFELKVTGPTSDLHSGMFGGVIHNPAQALCELIAGMHDENGKITLPGFYDDVRPLSDTEKQQLAKMPQTEEFFLKQTGAPALRGEQGYSVIEQNSARPTLDVHGLHSGFIGEGAKTVIPSWAKAKISMRTVPFQTPEKIAQQLKDYLTENAPNTITWELTVMNGGLPAFCDPDLPATKAMTAAMKSVWCVEPIFKREGASIPIVTEMQEILNLDSVLSGSGLPSDNVHAPNEKLDLSVWKKLIDAVILFLYNMKA